jgi:hypothetical protein
MRSKIGNKDSNTIWYPQRKYKLAPNGEKCLDESYKRYNKRLIYGDEYYGKPESNMFGQRSYNGNNTEGVINKLKSGWLERKLKEWENSNNPRYKLLLDEFNHPDTHEVDYTNSAPVLMRCDEIPEPILAELFTEVFFEKYGVGEYEECDSIISNVNDVKGKQMVRRSIRK